MQKTLTFVVWLPFAVSLGYLSYQGGVACRLPVLIAAGLAACLTCAGSVYAGRFRSTRSWVDLVGTVLSLALCVGFDFANLYDAIQMRAEADVMEATAGADVEAAEVERLRTAAGEAERAWIAARDLAEAERTQGKVSGLAGPGSTFDRLTAEAQNLEAVLQRRETALREAMTRSKEASVAAVGVDGGRHILAMVPSWVLLVAALALELCLAGLGWGLGSPAVEKEGRRADAPAVNGCGLTVAYAPAGAGVAQGGRNGHAFPEAAVALPAPVALVARSESGPDARTATARAADAPPNESEDGDSGGGKLIQLAGEEIKILARVARRAYRDHGAGNLRMAHA